MRTETATAPDLTALRPARDAPRSPGFPVYDDVAAVLAGPDPAPGASFAADARAHVLATTSAYAYAEDALTVATIAARLGLEGNRCVRVGQEVSGLLITSTAFLVQSADGATVVVAWRGTRPTGFVDLLGDIDVAGTRLDLPAGALAGQEVHAGFYRNTRATRADVLRRLENALHGHPIDADPERGDDGAPREPGPLAPLRSLHLTGHSLGGAQAALSAVLLCAEARTDSRRHAIARALRSVATFGQPMLGTPGFARAAAALPWPGPGGGRLGEHLVRWVHRDDVVARYPIAASGPYAHLGRECRYRPGSGWEVVARPSAQLDSVVALLLSPMATLAQAFAVTRDRWIGPSLDDHLPERYVDALRPAGVASEFGE